MQAQRVNSLPGIRFLAQPSAVGGSLPRMDVAGFVGFAERGPLHVPVAVEDPGQFLDVFGDDLPLAWDTERRAMQYSQLGSSVQLFFRNGGHRCWVVRVAQPEDGSSGAQTNTFRIPGLYATDALHTPARAQARAPGAWADRYKVGARLQPRALDAIDLDVHAAPNRYRLQLAPGPAAPQIGDLIELRSPESGLRIYLFVETLTVERGVQVVRARQAYWFEEQTSLGSPAPEDRSVELLPLDPALGLASWAAAGSPPPALRARLLCMVLLVWDGDRLQAKLDGLGFDPIHSRYWNDLPTDEALYRRILELGEGALGLELPPLWADAAGPPRFPLAGAADGARYLPLGMLATAASADAVAGDANLDAGGLGAEGLAELSADLFLDTDIGVQRSATVLSEAKHKQFVRGEPLHGIHSLMAIDEVSLLGVPDAVHRHWNRQPHLADPPLRAPWLDPVGALDSLGRRSLSWSPIAAARSYEVQQARTPEFDQPRLYTIDPPDALQLSQPASLPPAPPAGLLVNLNEDCPAEIYFRVRAVGYGGTSVWSNTQALRLPEGAFHGCGHADVETLGLRLQIAPGDTPGARRLSWTALSPVGLDARVKGFELQRGCDADFLTYDDVYRGHGTSTEQAVQSDVRAYYRVRVLTATAPGPWSNTLVVDPFVLSTDSLVPVAAYDAQDLLAVHCALARLCGARADCFALLSLPAHYRARDASDHLDELLPAPGESLIFGTGALHVHSLSPDEDTVLSHVGLFHPWFRHAFTGGGEVTSTPPDGAALGTIAARSLEHGAWFSPANTPLTEVLGLTPLLDQDSAVDLLQRHVNLALAGPRGFTLAQADTLSTVEELRSLSVRRFMHLLRRLVMREGTSYVFESNGTDFHEAVRAHWHQLLLDLYVRGALRGAQPDFAFRVVVDPTGEAARSPDLGRVVVELQVAPARPLRFINVRLIQAGAGGLAVQEA